MSARAENPSSTWLARFDELPVGSKFRFPVLVAFCAGTSLRQYYKTGDGSYGTAPGEPAFPWLGDVALVEAMA
jgi:hypothetical protein